MVRRHLVLGGSEGIGFAYAMYYARKGDCLTLVARRQRCLAEARTALLEAGAPVVAVIPNDLLDCSFRTRLSEERNSYDSILASGPSPPAGSLDDVLAADSQYLLLHGYQAALAYPLEVIRLALDRALKSPGTLYLIGSTASTEPILNSPFFLSASFRRIVDAMAQELTPRFREQGKRLRIWRPRVVLTPLSVAYARHEAGRDINEEEVRALLGETFCVPKVPTGEEYVREQIEHD